MIIMPVQRKVAAAGGAFTPASLTDSVWLDGGDTATMWSDASRATTIADGVGVQEWQAKGDNASLPVFLQATSGARPVWEETGGYVIFNGTSSYMTSLQSLFNDIGVLNLDGWSVYILARIRTSGTFRVIIMELDEIDNDPDYSLIRTFTPGTTSQVYSRNDARTTVTSTESSAFYVNNTLEVYGHVMDHTASGGTGALDLYTQDDTTPDQSKDFSPPALPSEVNRMVLGGFTHDWDTAVGSFADVDLYHLVAVPFAMGATDRADLTSWLISEGGL